jgi:hypothetical protein
VKIDEQNPPRLFEVGNGAKFLMKDCGAVRLEPDEQLTFVTDSGTQYDLARKDWGYYATPSLNARLLGFGLRAVLIKNPLGRYFVLLVERGKEGLFEAYLESEQLRLVTWLDTSERLECLERAVSAG